MKQDDDIGLLLAEPLNRLLSANSNRETLAQLETGEHGLPLWSAVSELSLDQALVPEADGGAGLGWTSLLPALLTLGSHASPVPLGETILATAALQAAGLDVPPGPLTLASTVLDLGDDGRIHGHDSLVPWLPLAAGTVVQARRAGQRYVVLLAASNSWSKDGQCTSVPVQTIGRVPSARLNLSGAPVLASRPMPADALDLLPALAVLRAALIAGGMQTVLQEAVTYAGLRTQFGKPIGKQQAIQQQLAELAMQTAAALVAAKVGCRALDSGHPDEAATGAAIAKHRASRAAGIGATVAHQVFGAIGITAEHVLHHHTRRLWQWRSEAGSEHHWAEFLGQRALSRGGAALWNDLVQPTIAAQN